MNTVWIIVGIIISQRTDYVAAPPPTIQFASWANCDEVVQTIKDLTPYSKVRCVKVQVSK